MVQNILYTFFGIAIAFLIPFIQDAYHVAKTPPHDFGTIWGGIMNSWEGLVIVIVIAGVILLIAHFHDAREKRLQKDEANKFIKQAIKEGIKEAIAELRTSNGGSQNAQPKPTDSPK